MNELPKTNLIDRAAAALEPLGLTLQKMKHPRGVPPLPAAAWVRVGKGRERIDYLAEARRTVTPATLGAMVMQLRHVAGIAGHVPQLHHHGPQGCRRDGASGFRQVVDALPALADAYPSGCRERRDASWMLHLL